MTIVLGRIHALLTHDRPRVVTRPRLDRRRGVMAREASYRPLDRARRLAPKVGMEPLSHPSHGAWTTLSLLVMSPRAIHGRRAAAVWTRRSRLLRLRGGRHGLLGSIPLRKRGRRRTRRSNGRGGKRKRRKRRKRGSSVVCWSSSSKRRRSSSGSSGSSRNS